MLDKGSEDRVRRRGSGGEVPRRGISKKGKSPSGTYVCIIQRKCITKALFVLFFYDYVVENTVFSPLIGETEAIADIPYRTSSSSLSSESSFAF